MRFVKGHGTQNDFILLDDPDGEYRLTPEVVRVLADRRTGLGADGVIRVVRSEFVDEPVSSTQGTEWFMDYWNADGSVAEMCGNGTRVFAAHLAARGWADLSGPISIGTRGGVKTVHREMHADGDLYATGMGAWFLEGGAAALAAGGDVTVTVGTSPGLPGLAVNTGNPHVVVLLPDPALLEQLDLSVPPGLDPAPAHGANVEFVVPTGSDDQAIGHVAMRVHERGVGETRSCGTGAVAAALAVRAFAAVAAAGPVPDEWQLDVPGGRLRVRVPAGTPAVEGADAELAGPAQLVAEGVLSEAVQPGRTTLSTR